MNDDLLEKLIDEEESEWLDFKRDQYPFAKATEQLKSELLKDIIAFANSWRKRVAYILIGVEEVKGGRSQIVGISKHLLNRNLQQFVNNMTNRPVDFSYRQYEYEGKEIGIIEISVQQRPIFLKKNYGKVVKNNVYYRLKDTTAVADPDEIARMRVSDISDIRKQPELDIQFAELKNRQLLGTELSLDSTHVVLKSIPNFKDKGFKLETIVEYINEESYLNKIGFAIINTSKIPAEDVHLKVDINYNPALIIRDKFDMPDLPSNNIYTLKGNFRPINQEKAIVKVNRYRDIWEINSDLGNIQPGATVWTKEEFLIGAKKSLKVEMDVQVVANNLIEPIEMKFPVKIDVKYRPLQIEDINNFLEFMELKI